jgi:glycerophosphoryl diester phosphodiesterase
MRPRFDRPIAHRGLHDSAAGIVENSATAFEAAARAGFAIECDLQLTSDGVPVVFHDPDRRRLTGIDGLVSDTSLAEMTAHPLVGSAAGDRPQSFADLLAQVAGRVLLQVELKHQSVPDGVATLARAAAVLAKAYPGPLVFMSFDPALVRLVRHSGFAGPVGIITARYDGPPDADEERLTPWQRFALRHLLHWPTTRFDFISAAQDALGLPAIRLFHALGVPVTSWTIRSAEQARAARPRADQLVFEGYVPASA